MNRIEIIKKYLTTNDLDILLEAEDALFWVDWGEYDSDIIEYCENMILSGQLSAKEYGEYGVEITYKGQSIKIDYPNDFADRDTTLTILSEVIKDNYSLRFSIDTDGSDTLGFVALKHDEWAEIEKEVGTDIVERKFKKIKQGDKIFG